MRDVDVEGKPKWVNGKRKEKRKKEEKQGERQKRWVGWLCTSTFEDTRQLALKLAISLASLGILPGAPA